MNLLVVLFLLVIVAVGYAATFAADVDLRVEERLVYGMVIGTMVVSTLGFVVAWIFGMSRASMVATMVVSLAAVAPLVAPRVETARADLASIGPRLGLRFRDQNSLRPLAALMAVSAIVSARILSLAYTPSANGGVAVGHLSTFGDWSAHLTYAASFAYADNFPPELPTAAGEPFTYHFGVDWFSAMFVPLGLSLPGALEVSSGFLAIAFPAVMYLASMRFVSGRLAAFFGTVIFLASGGTAALYRFLYDDLSEGGLSVLWDLPQSYAFDGFDRNWVDNAVTGFLYPQRPTMIGFSITFIVLAMLWQARHNDSKRTHLAAGIVVALMPIFHVFAFGVLVVLGIAWAVLERTKRWAWYLVPAIVIGAPIVLWQRPAEDGTTWHAMWVLGKSSWDRNPVDFVWFWLLNTGLFIPLAVWGLWRHRDDLGRRFLPILGLLLVPNVAIWHFWEGNNVKYVIFFLLLGAPFVGERLAVMWRSAFAYRMLAALLLVTLTLSGGLDIWRAFEGSSGAYPADYLRGDDVLVGEWARDNTEPDAVFAVAGDFTDPVRVIAGRTAVTGAEGRLRDLGVDYEARRDDLRIIYGVFEGFEEVIDRYDIDYLVLGNDERTFYRPADAPADWDPAIFWDAAAPLVYDIGSYRVYDVSGYQS